MAKAKSAFIYCLICPTTGLPRYIGKTSNLSQRFKNHLNKARDIDTHKRNWINLLRKDNLKPVIIVLEKVVDNWQERERWWIRYFRRKGYDLVNYTLGGEGLSSANQTTFKSGHVPWNKGISPKKEIREAIRQSLLGRPSKKRLRVEKYSLDSVLLNTYESLTEAALLNDASISKICLCCKNKRKSHKEFIWKYK